MKVVNFLFTLIVLSVIAMAAAQEPLQTTLELAENGGLDIQTPEGADVCVNNAVCLLSMSNEMDVMNATAQEKILELQEQVHQSTFASTTMQGQVEAAASTITAMQGQLNASTSTSLAMQGQVEAAASTISAMQGQFLVATSLITQLQSEVSTLKKQPTSSVTVTCNANTVGLLKEVGSLTKKCNGTSWVEASNVLGSIFNPAGSCEEMAVSPDYTGPGVYYISWLNAILPFGCDGTTNFGSDGKQRQKQGQRFL
jgi:hypothetical protein